MKKYTTPEIELLALAANDVILTSQIDDSDVLSLEETAEQNGFTAVDDTGKNQGFDWQSNWGNW